MQFEAVYVIVYFPHEVTILSLCLAKIKVKLPMIYHYHTQNIEKGISVIIPQKHVLNHVFGSTIHNSHQISLSIN